MFSKNSIIKSTSDYSSEIAKLKEKIDTADAILIGAGAGLSASAGHSYTGERFAKHFFDFSDKYGISDMYSGGFYPYESIEEYFAWWSRHIKLNRYDEQESKVHQKLLSLMTNKNYFVLTTNVDHLFQLNGFDKKKLFYTQGDYGLFQCSKGCHNINYDNREQIFEMVSAQKNMKIPTDLVPHCPKCGSVMVPNLRCDNNFVQDDGWHNANSRYEDFVRRNKKNNILFLELGVGLNTPIIIKYPFWMMTAQNKNATYATLNLDSAATMKEIKTQSICIQQDIYQTINNI